MELKIFENPPFELPQTPDDWLVILSPYLKQLQESSINWNALKPLAGELLELINQLSKPVQLVIYQTLVLGNGPLGVSRELGFDYNLVYDYRDKFIKAADRYLFEGDATLFEALISRSHKLQKRLSDAKKAIAYWQSLEEDPSLTVVTQKMINYIVSYIGRGNSPEVDFSDEEYQLIWYALIENVNLRNPIPSHLDTIRILFAYAGKGRSPNIVNSRIRNIVIAAYAKLQTFRPDLVAEELSEEES